MRVKDGKGGRGGTNERVERARLESESRRKRKTGERDKENLEKGVIGFEKLSYISSYGQVRLCAGM